MNTKTFSILCFFAGVLACIFFVFFSTQRTAVVIESPVPLEAQYESSFSSSSSTPESVRLTVPFITQAPYRHWDDVHEETCEEATLLIVHAYLSHLELNEENAEVQLQDLVAWQRQRFGYFEDTTVHEVAVMAQERFGYHSKILNDITESDIEYWVAHGYPVIVPTAGRMLGNPYFTGEGPWYHMLAVIGYDPSAFIVHDVGTRRGANYRYNRDLFMKAIHDWTGVKERVSEGPKVGLVLGKFL